MKRKFIKYMAFFYLPQIQVFFVLLILAILMICLSINIGDSFWSSFCSNISAGLFTGLVICLVSGSKSAYLNKLETKKVWLEKIHVMILEYINLWYKYISNDYDSKNEYEFVYDIGAHANWVNEFIIQSQFDKYTLFNVLDLCKKDFNYDAMVTKNDFNDLKEKIMDDNWNKKDVLRMFETVDSQLRKLNSSVLQEMDAINRIISICNKSII